MNTYRTLENLQKINIEQNEQFKKQLSKIIQSDFERRESPDFLMFHTYTVPVAIENAADTTDDWLRGDCQDQYAGMTKEQVFIEAFSGTLELTNAN